MGIVKTTKIGLTNINKIMIKQNQKYTHGALAAPKYPDSLPAGCKWLGGEGYGVWFLMTQPEHFPKNEYRIRRYSHTGNLDCDRIFELNSDKIFFINKEFEFGYVSHCQKCTIVQNDNFFIFNFSRTFDFN